MKKKDEKKKKLGFKKTLSNNLWALGYLWKCSPVYFTVYLSSVFVYTVLGFFSEGYLLRKIVNTVETGGDIQAVITYVFVLGILTCISTALLYWFWHVKAVSERMNIWMGIEKMLFRKSVEVELSCYENPAFYDKYVRAMDSSNDRIMAVLNSLYGLINKAISLFANSLLLFVIDPWLILFGLFPLVLGFFRRLQSRVHHDFVNAEKPIFRRGDYVRRTFYLSDYAKEMRIGGMYELMLRDFANTFKDYRVIIRKYGIKKALYGYIQKIGLDVVTVLGATLYSVWSAMCIGPEAGGMNIGDCLVVLGSIGVISYCLNNLVQNFAEFGEHALFLEDIRYFIDYEPKIRDGARIAPKCGGDLEVKDISFTYEGSDSQTLKNVSFTLRKGERIALVGSNGSGKTTLVKLLLRLYDPDYGEILLDGKDVKDMTVESYRGSFSTVFQDFKIFSMSVRDNVLLRPYKEGDEALTTDALRESGVFEKINSFDRGIDTILTREFDDKGENLSVGEQQKLSLARVFAEDKPFVILDEPSSALDPIAEYKMFENMMRATEGRSVIFISHRLSSAVLADRVILMENGQIAEIGTHTELMSKNGKYASMFRRQAENYLGEDVAVNV